MDLISENQYELLARQFQESIGLKLMEIPKLLKSGEEAEQLFYSANMLSHIPNQEYLKLEQAQQTANDPEEFEIELIRPLNEIKQSLDFLLEGQSNYFKDVEKIMSNPNTAGHYFKRENAIFLNYANFRNKLEAHAALFQLLGYATLYQNFETKTSLLSFERQSFNFACVEQGWTEFFSKLSIENVSKTSFETMKLELLKEAARSFLISAAVKLPYSIMFYSIRNHERLMRALETDGINSQLLGLFFVEKLAGKWQKLESKEKMRIISATYNTLPRIQDLNPISSTKGYLRLARLA